MVQHSGLIRLTIANPNETDSGEYKCEIALSGQPVQSMVHNLTVKPSIASPVPEERPKRCQQKERAERQQPSTREHTVERHTAPVALASFMKNLTIEEGNRAKFVCSVIGKVDTVEWFKDNVPLQPELDRRYRLTNSDAIVGLEIQDVVPSDSGFYTCTINGRRNSVTSSSKLTVYEAYKSRKKSLTYDRPPMPSSLSEFIAKGKHFPYIMSKNEVYKQYLKKKKSKFQSTIFFGINSYFFHFLFAHEICIFLWNSIFLDTSKHLDHSFERLIRSSRARSPIRREFTSSSHRESYLPIRDISTSISIRDSLPITTPYRSKSYHGELNRITHSTIPSHYDDFRTDYKSIRSLSHSASNLSARNSLTTLHSSYVNAYSRHHSHHNHHVPIAPRTPVQINNRSRFRARNAYKAYRSRSANRLDDRDYVVPIGIRSSTSRTKSPSTIPYYPHRDFLSTTGLSKSLSDIRTIQSRINSDLFRSLYRESYSSIRNIDDSSELTNHILNPDIYLRWLKNKWSMEDRFRHERSASTRSYIDDFVRSTKSYLRDGSYQSRVKFSHDSRQRRQQPFFSKTIRGKQQLASNSIFPNSFKTFIYLLKTLSVY